MPESAAQRAIGASSLALLVACASIAAFLPPLFEATMSSIVRTVLLGASAVVGVVLHWVYLGIAAHRLERSTAGWVSLALLFPVGGTAALMLLGLFGAEPSRHAAPAPLRGA